MKDYTSLVTSSLDINLAKSYLAIIKYACFYRLSILASSLFT